MTILTIHLLSSTFRDHNIVPNSISQHCHFKQDLQDTASNTEASFIERTICRVFECTETIHIFVPPKVYIILRFPIFKLSTLQQKKRQTGKSTLINNNYYPAGITRHLLISKRVTQLTSVILRSLQAF